MIPKEILDKLVPVKKVKIALPGDPIHYRLKPEPCRDCGCTLKKPRIVDIKLVANPYPNWRSTCTNCRKIQNPLTDEWDLDSQSIRAFLIQHRDELDK